jgi:hypothetical protein
MGYELDPEWIEQRFGVKLLRDGAGSPVRAVARPDVLTLAGEKKNSRPARWLNSPPPPMTRW